MTILFNKALVRRTSYNIIKAISSKNLHPSYEEINLEHNKYISALKNSDLNVTILDPLNDIPDSIFVEDPGLTYKNNYISLRQAENSRFGESKIMAKDVNELFDNKKGGVVMAENPEIRNNRLNLICLIRNYSLKLADFRLL